MYCRFVKLHKYQNREQTFNTYFFSLFLIPLSGHTINILLSPCLGYDGGLPQYFFLEAYDSRTRKLRLNITSALNDVPLFRIDLAGI